MKGGRTSRKGAKTAKKKAVSVCASGVLARENARQETSRKGGKLAKKKVVSTITRWENGTLHQDLRDNKS